MEAPSPCIPSAPSRIAGHPAALLTLDVAGRGVRLCVVPDLESLVDRGAVLRGEQDPPYWAHLWSGARTLASYAARFVPLVGKRVLEIGCGLGLPGLTAAVLGAEVTLVDAEPAALAFAEASAAANGVRVQTIVADFARLDPTATFDVVLAAEVAYDRAGWDTLAATCERHLAPGGTTFLADGYRTDTRGLYAALARRDLDVHAIDLRVVEDDRPCPLRIATVRAAGLSRRDSRRPPL